MTPSNKQLIHAFDLGGRAYYRFAEDSDMPAERFVAAILAMNELSMNCTREWLQAHTAAVLAAANENNLVQVVQLASDLQARLDWSFTPEQVYRLASIIFIDAEEEQTGRYSPDYCRAKIARWREALGGNEAAFFLQKPISELTGQLRLSATDLQLYLVTVRKLDLKQSLAVLEEMQSLRSTNVINPGSVSSLSVHTKALIELLSLQS